MVFRKNTVANHFMVLVHAQPPERYLKHERRGKAPPLRQAAEKHLQRRT